MAVTLKLVDEIPEEMLEAFRREADAPSSTVRDARNAEVKIGAFQGKELVGFISAGPFSNVLTIYGMYVSPKSRGKKIGTRFVYRVAGEAKKRGLHGVDLNKMVWNTKWLVEREARRWNAKGEKSPLKFTVHHWEEGFFGEIRFKRPKKMTPKPPNRKKPR